ncbi:MAG: C40 family peptidase [Rhodobacteraceae bacterium]|nr:C40 family peptidase [Paracoccaceae bacterium]
MSDARFLFFNGLVAEEGLRGRIRAPRFRAPRPWRVVAALAPMLARPGGGLSCQILHGEVVDVLDEGGGFVFARARRDGYVGYLPAALLSPGEGPVPTHRVATTASHLYARPEVKAPRPILLPMGARLAVEGTGPSGFARLAGRAGFVPEAHLAPLDAPSSDPVAMAAMLRGIPYLWGGETVLGVDCSGLVRLAFDACRIALPRDSDLQSGAGRMLEPGEALVRGDLVFWRGHVGLMEDGTRLLHANAHPRAGDAAPLAAAEARIAGAGGGGMTARRRL